jgi:hypothetical protein
VRVVFEVLEDVLALCGVGAATVLVFFADGVVVSGVARERDAMEGMEGF